MINMKKEHIEAAGNFLSTYYSDLNYIRSFQKFKQNKISESDFIKKGSGTFYSFLIEYRVVRGFSKGSADKLLRETMDWVNGKHADKVDLFAEKLSKTNITRGHVPASMASKILFLNNPWKIIPMDQLARNALKQKENKYSVYNVNLINYRDGNRRIIDSFLQNTSHLTKIVAAEFINEIADLNTITENRAIDKLLWTIGQKG